MNEQVIEQARQLHRSGKFAEAIASYARALADEPDRADLWHLKAVAEHQARQLDAAADSIARAIAAGGEQPLYLLLEAGLLHDRGDLAGAESRLLRVAAEKPAWSQPLLELGTVRLDQGRPLQALEAFRAASALDATSTRAWNGVALSLMGLDRIDEAVRALNHLITLAPRYALAYFNLARIANLKLDNAKALEHAQVAVRLEPTLVDAWLLLGDVHRRRRDGAAAQAAYANAVKAAPGSSKARNALAEIHAEVGHFESARNEYRAISGMFPANLKAALGANLLLPQIYLNGDHLEHCRREFAEGLDQLDRMAGNFHFPREDVALSEARWTNFYLAYQGRDDAPLQKRYGEFLKRVLQPALPRLYEPRRRRSGGERIRVG